MIAFIDDHREAYGVEPICKVLPIGPTISRCVGLLEIDCLAGHIGVEPANPQASHPIGIP